ncbi:MAG TPA: response regulator transcription factor [Gaiellaceae bacterium]|nr:response regulator transcription factor [Gaiellaceae bacterium]
MTASCLVADDHSALRAAVADLVAAEGYRVVGPAADGAQAVAAAAEAQPELAVLDYWMPVLEGEALLRELLAASPATRVLVYTADRSAELAREALAAGAVAVVLKEAPLADLSRALRAVAAGRSYLDPGLASRDAVQPVLTEREREVLELLTLGLQHEEVGRRLGIGAETVRTHVRKASSRLGATSRTHAVAKALRLGLIE